MKGTKEQRGITLIALIITIVVLLILAAVAISSITNDGILGYAQSAADKYNQAQRDEAGVLQNYLAFIDPCGTKGSHTWGEPIVLVAADCKTKTNGTQEVTCSECGAKETQEVFYKHNSYHYDECTECGAFCEDDNEIIKVPLHYTVGGANDWSHYTEDTCNHCNLHYYGDLDQAHTYENGICTVCEWVCQHSEAEVRYTQKDATTHFNVLTCDEEHCGGQVEIIGEEAHTYYDNYTETQHTCTKCGYSENHEYNENYSEYEPRYDGTHTWNTACDAGCGHWDGTWIEDCTYVNGTCTYCGHEQE